MKVVLVGLNYKRHAKELNMSIPDEPVIFLKPETAIISNGESIVLPQGVGRVDYEGEIGIRISRKCRSVRKDEVLSVISGVIALNDVTARDIQKRDGQWTRAKSFDTFCPVSNEEIKISSLNDFDRLTLRTFLNNKEVQSSTPMDMIFDIPYIVSFVSDIMTLLPGDIISTGTPEGVGKLKRGDNIEIRVSMEAVVTSVSNTVV